MKRKALFTLILGTALAVAPALHAAPMPDGGTGNGFGSPVSSSTSRPYGMNEATYQAVVSRDSAAASQGMTRAESRALTIRSEALNTLYGNAVTDLTPQQFKALYLAGLNRMTPQEQAAVVARSAGLNQAYGAGGNAPVAAQQGSTTTDDSSIVWNATYGAAALTGAMLLVLGFAVVTRRRHHHQPGF